MVPEFFDFFALAEDKERMERKKEEKEKESILVHGDQNPQEATSTVPVTAAESFTNECRRPRTNRRVLGTMRMTEEGPSYHMIGDSADIVVAGYPLSSRQEVAVITDVRRKPRANRIVQSQKSLDLDLQGPSYHLISNSANVVVASDLLSSRQEVAVINDAHWKPRAKRIVQTEKSLDLDLNQPPPAVEEEREKKSGIRKRKGENPSGKTNTQKKSGTKGSSGEGPNPPPELPQEIIDQIRLRAQAAGRADVDDGGVILVVQKKLTKSDLEKSQNRLIFTKNQLRTENFLSEMEKNSIKKENGRCLSFSVPIIEPSNNVPEVKFTQWTRGTNHSDSFVINGSWVKIISSKENPPKLGQIVQLWAFRLNGNLNFALVFLPMEGHNNTSAGADESSEVTRLTSMASTSEAAPEETEDASNRTPAPPAEAAVPITGDGDNNIVAKGKEIEGERRSI